RSGTATVRRRSSCRCLLLIVAHCRGRLRLLTRLQARYFQRLQSICESHGVASSPFSILLWSRRWSTCPVDPQSKLRADPNPCGASRLRSNEPRTFPAFSPALFAVIGPDFPALSGFRSQAREHARMQKTLVLCGFLDVLPWRQIWDAPALEARMHQ